MGGFGINISWGNQKKPLSVERDNEGNWFYTMFKGGLKSKKGLSDSDKLDLAFENPAFLKVLTLNCDLFSLGKINSYENNKLKEIDVLYSVKKKPNYFQTWTKFNWEYLMYRMIFGYSVLRIVGNDLSRATLYWLNPARIDYNGKEFSRIVFSEAQFNSLRKKTIKYQHLDGRWEDIPLTELEFIQDLSNTSNSNFLIGRSRMDALLDVISNSGQSIRAKGGNLDFADKFLVSGQHDPENVTGLPMSEDDKRSAESILKGNKRVHAVKSKVDINRFTDNLANLKLDDSYIHDLYVIGSMYGTPREVIDANVKGSTYENQEKATGKHVEYSLKPAATALTDVLEERFDYQDLRMEWSHLSFNQVFEKDKADRQGIQLDNLQKAINLGVEIPDLSKRVDDILTM